MGVWGALLAVFEFVSRGGGRERAPHYHGALRTPNRVAGNGCKRRYAAANPLSERDEIRDQTLTEFLVGK
jgi:hypothetical protein